MAVLPWWPWQRWNKCAELCFNGPGNGFPESRLSSIGKCPAFFVFTDRWYLYNLIIIYYCLCLIIFWIDVGLAPSSKMKWDHLQKNVLDDGKEVHPNKLQAGLKDVQPNSFIYTCWQSVFWIRAIIEGSWKTPPPKIKIFKQNSGAW